MRSSLRPLLGVPLSLLLGAWLAACPSPAQMEVSTGLSSTRPMPVVVSYWQYMPDMVRFGDYRVHSIDMEDPAGSRGRVYSYKIDTPGTLAVSTECEIVYTEKRRFACVTPQTRFTIRLDEGNMATAGEIELPRADGSVRKAQLQMKTRTAAGEQGTRGLGYEIGNETGPLGAIQLGEAPRVWILKDLPDHDALYLANALSALLLLNLKLDGATRLHPNVGK